MGKTSEAVIFIGQADNCRAWISNTYKRSADTFEKLDKQTYMREFLKWMRMVHDPMGVAIVELPPRVTQVQLLKPIEEMHSCLVVFHTTAVNAALPTLIGRCRVVRGDEVVAVDPKIIEKLIDAEKADASVHVALYREAGDVDRHQLETAVKAAQFTASGEKALKLLDMHELLKRCKSAKEFIVQWLWAR